MQHYDLIRAENKRIWTLSDNDQIFGFAEFNDLNKPFDLTYFNENTLGNQLTEEEFSGFECDNVVEVTLILADTLKVGSDFDAVDNFEDITGYIEEIFSWRPSMRLEFSQKFIATELIEEVVNEELTMTRLSQVLDLNPLTYDDAMLNRL